MPKSKSLQLVTKLLQPGNLIVLEGYVWGIVLGPTVHENQFGELLYISTEEWTMYGVDASGLLVWSDFGEDIINEVLQVFDSTGGLLYGNSVLSK